MAEPIYVTFSNFTIYGTGGERGAGEGANRPILIAAAAAVTKQLGALPRARFRANTGGSAEADCDVFT